MFHNLPKVTHPVNSILRARTTRRVRKGMGKDALAMADVSITTSWGVISRAPQMPPTLEGLLT